MPDWNTTHLAKNNAYNSNGKGPYAGKQLQLFGDHAHILSTPHNNIWVELCNAAISSIYQEIAAPAGKIYEWSLDHGKLGTPSGGKDVMAVIIGPAINSATDYNTSLSNNGVSVTNRYQSNVEWTYTNNGRNLYSEIWTDDYPYGIDENSYFRDIVLALLKSKKDTSATDVSSLRDYGGQSFIQEFNGHKYYVYLCATSTEAPTFTRYSGVYSLPEASTISVFGFVSVHAAGIYDGNHIDNVVFSSGSPIVSDKEVSYTSEVQLSAATQPGYAYAILEVSGSTVLTLGGTAGAAHYDGDGDGADSTARALTADPANGWYIESFAAGGLITFTNLTVDKVYRIVGIPAAAINPDLGVNERPENVLDEGYYQDTWIALPYAGKPDCEVVGGLVCLTVTQARSDMEYALLIDSAGTGTYKLAHDWTEWKQGENDTAVFRYLTPDAIYYIVSRPVGYGMSYAQAAGNAVTVQTCAVEGDPTAVYDNNTSTADRPLVVGGKGSILRFTTSPSVTLGLDGADPKFDQSGEDSDWFDYDYDNDVVLTNHKYLDVYIKKDPGEHDRTGSIRVWTPGYARADTIYLMQPRVRCVSTKQTNMDTSFFVAFLPNSAGSTSIDPSTNLFLYATTNAKKSNVSVADNSTGNAVGTSVEVAQNKVKTVFSVAGLSANLESAVGTGYNNTYQTEGVVKSLRVRADSAISLYAYNAASATSEISCIIPQSALGDEYFTVSYRGAYSQNPEVFLVVASEDNTLVTITPSVNLSSVKESKVGKAGIPFTVKLGKAGSTYLVKALTHTSELTGTHLKASKPVAVFSGVERGYIAPGYTSGDHVFEQMLPLRAWGKQYAVVNTSLPSNTYRVVAAYDNTGVTITGKSGAKETTTLKRGEFLEHRIVTSASPFAYIEATQPVQVGLFAESQTYLAPPGGNSDPFLIAVGPADRGVFNATFSPIKSYNGTAKYPDGQHYMTVIVNKHYKDSTTLRRSTNGLSGKVKLEFTDMPGTPYAYAVEDSIIYNEDYNYQLTNPYGFTAYAYGYGSYEGYGYLIGAQLGEQMGGETVTLEGVIKPSYRYCLNQTSDLPKCINGSETCTGDSERYYWYNTLTDWYNDKPLTEPPVVPTSHTGTYTYFASQLGKGTCPGVLYPQQITVEVVAIPSVVLNDVSVCLSDSRTTYGGTPAGGSYVFANGEKQGQPFNHKEAGEGPHRVSYSYANAAGCPVTDTATVTVITHHPTISSPDGSSSICNGETLRLQVNPEAGYPITYTQWYRNDSTIFGAQGSMYAVSPTADSFFYASGRYAVLARDSRGCETLVDTAVVINPRPSKPKIVTSDPAKTKAVCPGESIALKDTFYYNNPGCYYQWYRGNVVSEGNKMGNSSISSEQTVKDDYNGIQQNLPFILGVAKPIANHPDNKACWMYDTVNVTVYPRAGKPQIHNGSSVHSYCAGDSVRVRVIPSDSETDSYRWNFTYAGTQKPLPATGNEIYAKERGYYYVWGKSDYGCESTEPDTVEVKQYHKPPAPTIDGDTAVCPGSAGNAAVLTAFSAANSYQWYFVNAGGGSLTEAIGETSDTFRTASSGDFAVRAYLEHTYEGGSLRCPSDSTSPPYKITIYPVIPPPVVTGNGIAGSGFACINTPHSLTATSSNPNVTSYQWYKNGSSTGERTNTFAETFAGNEDSASYKVYAVGYPKQCASEFSSPKVVRKRKPAVSIAISNGHKPEICFGEQVIIGAATTDVGAGSKYQWYKNVDSIPGPDSKFPSYTVKGSSNVSETNSYHLHIVDQYGCKAEPSSAVHVSIHEVPATPSVTITPSPVCENSDFTLQAAPAGMGTYEWLFVEGSQPLGAPSTDTSLRVAGAKMSHMGSYRVTVTNNYKCSSQGDGYIQVLPAPPQPVITSATRRACKGEAILLEAFDSKGGFDYDGFRWYFDDGGGKKPLPGSTADSIYAAAAGKYSVRGVKGSCESPESEVCDIEILPRPTRPAVTSATATASTPSGDSIGVCESEAPTLTGASPGALLYEWCMAGSSGIYEPVSGKSASGSYRVEGSGRYAVYAYSVHDGDLQCRSDSISVPVRVTLFPMPAKPKILGTLDACAGQTVTLRTEKRTENATIASYLWYKGGLVVSGVEADSCVVSQVEDAYFTVRAVSDRGCRTAPSDTVKVRIRQPIAAIDGAEQVRTTCHGDGASVVLTATSGPGNVYRWYKNDTSIPSAVGYQLAVQSEGDKTVEQSNLYKVEIVRDEAGCASENPSNPVRVILRALPAKPVAENPPPGCAGYSVTLSVSPANEAQYEWFHKVKGAFTSIGYTANGSITIPNAQTGNAGEYMVRIANSWKCQVQAEMQVVVYPLPYAPVITPHDEQHLCTGDSVRLTAITADASDTCRWYFFDGSSNVYQRSGAALTATRQGTYSAWSKSRYSCLSEKSDTVTVTIHRRPDAPIITPEGSPLSVCANGSTTIAGAVADATSYQWYIAKADGSYAPIYSATESSYTVSESGRYALRAYKQYDSRQCFSLSDLKEMEVLPVPPPPTVSGEKTAAGEKTAGCDGETILLTAYPGVGSAPVTVQWFRWYKNSTEQTFVIGNQFPITQVNEDGLHDEYRVEAISDKNCASAPSAAKEVIIRRRPTVAIAKDPNNWTSCGSAITLTAVTSAESGTYQWYRDNDTPMPEAASAAAYVVQPNIDRTVGKENDYYLFVTDGYGCQSAAASNTVRVNIRALPPLPAIAINPAKGVCEGSDATLTVSPAGAGAYRWFKRSGRTFDSIYTSSLNAFTVREAQAAADAGTYAVEITDGYGCTSATRAEAELNVLGLPEVFFTATKACEDWTDFRYVDPPGGKFIGWGCTADSAKFIPADVHQGKAVVTYMYRGPNGCVSSAREDIEIVRLPNIPAISPADNPDESLVEVCPGDFAVTLETRLAVNPADQNASYSYQWRKDGFAIPGDAGQGLSYIATKTGAFDVRVCNQNLCWAASPSEAVTIVQLPPPTPPVITAQSLTFCPGESVALTVTPQDDGAYKGIFQWYMGNGKKMEEIPDEIADTYLAYAAGQYAVDYVGESGCRSAFSNPLTITEHPLPKLPEIIPSQPTLYSSMDYSLLVKYPYSDELYGWYKNTLYAGVDGPAFPIKDLGAIDTGTYTVKVTNLQGCYVWSEPYMLNLTKADLFIPNIFTPNGDGINDYFQIIGLDEFVENKLEIINKRGTVIYSQKNYHNEWDGNGLPNDVFYYTLELKRKDGTTSRITGFVHLKR